MKKEKIKIESAEQAHAIVTKLTVRTLEYLRKDLMKYETRSQWLLMARVINYVFTSHFKASVDLANAKIEMERRK